MANRQPLRRLGLDESIVTKMTSAKLHNVGDLFSRTELQLVQELNLTRYDVVGLLKHVSSRIAPAKTTAGQLLRERRESGGSFCLATGLPTIDNCLQGGFPAGMITELVGSAGIGKTQACLMMAAQACLPTARGGLGEDAGVVYLDTERKFSPDRLVEIASSRSPSEYGESCPQGLSRLLEQVTVYTVDTSSALLERLESLQTRIIEGNVRLIILDSVAALARRDFGREEVVNRQHLLTRQATVLKTLAYTFSIVVIVTNQVTTSFGQMVDSGAKEGEGIASGNNTATFGSPFGHLQGPQEELVEAREGSYLTPALGNTWHHCVSNRLILEQHAEHREMHLSKSPLAPPVSCRYSVQDKGLVEEC